MRAVSTRVPPFTRMHIFHWTEFTRETRVQNPVAEEPPSRST
jgi:hypothetical protein